MQCGMPTVQRQVDVRTQVLLATGSSTTNTTYAQDQALQWLIYNDDLSLCPHEAAFHVALVQRFILAVFWYTCGGPYWTLSNATVSSFLNASRPECQWHGVQCDLNHAITALHLDNSNVSCPASLPNEMAALSYLIELDMDSNAIAGTIPDWMGTAWSHLEIIDLDSNRLTGSIPLSLYQATALRVLDLDHNALSGTIDGGVSNWTNLFFLQVDFNRLSGTIPSSLGALSQLHYLSLLGNNFSATLPSSLCSHNSSTASNNRTNATAASDPAARIVYANCQLCTMDDCCSACLNFDTI
jgi:Leucine-rich repeat (LRR) protein